VIVGGDGTLREAIDGLGDARRNVPIGIVPMGNANVVARELGIGSDVDEAIRVAIEGAPEWMDVGTVRGDDFDELFLAVVGLGWDAHAVRLMDRMRHSQAGGTAYRLWADGLYGVAGLAASLRPGQERFTLVVDGEPLRARYCAAWFCNLRTYGKGMAVTPDAHRGSGRIHVQARKRASLPFLLTQLASALRGTRTPQFISDYVDGKTIRMEADELVAIEVDGDDLGWTRTLEIGVMRAAASVLVPMRPRDV
jgi:diacylglycerol kinase (ATP)